MKKVVETSSAPAPIGPYSQAILAGNTLYVSGQIPINPVDGELRMADIRQETQQVMANIEAILNKEGMHFKDVVKCSIFLSDMGLFAEVNEIYGRHFNTDPPARETVEVSGLPKNVNVEISCIAVK